MDVTLVRIGEAEATRLWHMQTEAFLGLYEKYRDTETSPAAEPIERVAARLRQPFTYYYFIQTGQQVVGAIRVVDRNDPQRPKRISPIFVMPPFRNRGIAQRAIQEAERIHGSENWELDTILQETGNCHLYEKMGYRPTGETRTVNDEMTLVFYRK